MTDASGKTGLGYQILQIWDDNQLHAISYGSQALTKASETGQPVSWNSER